MKRPTGRFPPKRKRPLEQEWPFHLDGARGRNRTGTTVKSRDFKSLVSTSFTTRAEPNPQTSGFVKPDPVFIHPWMMKSPVDLGSTGLSIVEAEVGIEPAYTDLQSVSKTLWNHCLTRGSFPQAFGILQPETQHWCGLPKSMRKRFSHVLALAVAETQLGRSGPTLLLLAVATLKRQRSPISFPLR